MDTLRALGRLLRRLYRRFFQRQVSEELQEVIDTLQQVPAFASCSRSTLQSMAETMHQRTYRRGECLYYEGDPGLGLYVIQQGSVRLTTEEDPGTAYELRRLGPHEVFGLLAIVGDFKRLETAQTVAETRVFGFFRPDLKNLVKRNPHAGAEVLSALARHLATHHVALIQLMAEREGRSSALYAYAEAAAADDVAASLKST